MKKTIVVVLGLLMTGMLVFSGLAAKEYVDLKAESTTLLDNRVKLQKQVVDDREKLAAQSLELTTLEHDLQNEKKEYEIWEQQNAKLASLMH